MRGSSAEHGGTPAAATAGRPGGRAPRWPGIVLLALFALGSVAGLTLWGQWGFLIAFDTIRAYCF